MSELQRIYVKPTQEPQPPLVYVNEARFRKAMQKRGLYNTDQIARDIKWNPQTFSYRLHIGSFPLYIAQKIENVIGIAPDEYEPARMVQIPEPTDGEPMLTDEEIERLADRLAEKIIEKILPKITG